MEEQESRFGKDGNFANLSSG